MNPVRLKTYIYLLIVALIWGIAGPVIKITLTHFPADIFLFYRFGISTIIAIFFLARSHFKFKGFKSFLLSTLYAFLNVPAALLVLFWGIERTSLVEVGVISLFGPLLTIYLGYTYLKEHVTLREKIGIIIAFGGSFLILIEPILKSHDLGKFEGNVLVFFYILFTAIASLILKKLVRSGESPTGLAHYSFIVGFLVMIPLALPTLLNSRFQILASVPFTAHAGVWYMALLSGTLAFSLQNIGQKTIELSEAALFLYIHPIISALLAIWIFGDVVTPTIIIGVVITFVGVFLAEIKKTI